MLSKQAALKYTGTHRTFPVPRNVPGKVLLFLVSSVFPYSKGEQGRYGEPLFSPHLLAILYFPKLKKYINLRKSN